jgi:hypothetical protein
MALSHLTSDASDFMLQAYFNCLIISNLIFIKIDFPALLQKRFSACIICQKGANPLLKIEKSRISVHELTESS